MLMILFRNMCWENIILKLLWHLQGIKELKHLFDRHVEVSVYPPC